MEFGPWRISERRYAWFGFQLQTLPQTLKKKIEVMKSFGCSEEEILGAFKRGPTCLALSEEKISHAMDIYINTMKLGLETIVSRPKFLTYSIDKRIRPRYNVLKKK